MSSKSCQHTMAETLRWHRREELSSHNGVANLGIDRLFFFFFFRLFFRGGERGARGGHEMGRGGMRWEGGAQCISKFLPPPVPTSVSQTTPYR